jgi:hypothetical protein
MRHSDRRRALRGLLNAFREADSDDSGAVDHDELHALLVARFASGAKGWLVAKSPAEVRQLTDRLLIAFDADGSGELEQGEFIRLAKHLWQIADARDLLLGMAARFDAKVDAATQEASKRLGSSGSKRKPPASSRKQKVKELLTEVGVGAEVLAAAKITFDALRRGRRDVARQSPSADEGGDNGEVGSSTCTRAELSALLGFVESGRLAAAVTESTKRSSNGSDDIVELREQLKEAHEVKLYLSAQVRILLL